MQISNRRPDTRKAEVFELFWRLSPDHLSVPGVTPQDYTATHKQESGAIAKMTALCALYMDALKIFVSP